MFISANDNPYITGVGNRETPAEIITVMEDLGCWLADRGFTIRSGGAQGADAAFERGVVRSSNPDALEIYVPWSGFGKPQGERVQYRVMKDHYCHDIAKRLAMEVIGYWDNCSYVAKQLHTRNIYEVLGEDLNAPSAAVFYYAKLDINGEELGGTRTAVMLARQRGVPTFNLLQPFTLAMVKTLIYPTSTA